MAELDAPTPNLSLRVIDRRGLWLNPLGVILRVNYFNGEEPFSEQSQTNYARIDVVGRGENYLNWIGTDNVRIPVQFNFRVQGSGNEAIYREVIYPARFLAALKHPLYDPATTLSYAPPTCILSIGRMLTARVILESGDIQWQGPIEPRTLLAHGAIFSAQFAIVRAPSPDLSYRYESITRGLWV